MELALLSAAGPLPFAVAVEPPVAETLRCQYRFLDLRRRIVLRVTVIPSIPKRMSAMGFSES